MLIELKQAGEALKVFEASIKGESDRFHSVVGGNLAGFRPNGNLPDR